MKTAVRYFSKLGNTKKLPKLYFYAHMLHINGRIEAAREFGNHITRKS